MYFIFYSLLIMDKKKVVILGAGFAGIRTFYNLSCKKEFDITVVDQRDSMLLKPVLPEVAYDGKDISKTNFKLEPVIKGRGHTFIQSSVTAIDPKANTVSLENGTTLNYDYLFITMGAHKDFNAIPGHEEFGYSVCDDVHAVKLAKAVENFKGGKIVIGSAKSSWGTRVKCPPFQAPCEGPIGESMFMLHHLLSEKGLRDKTTIDVFTPGEIFFEDIGNDVRGAVGGLMGMKKIDLHLAKVAKEITKDAIKFEDGTELPADMVIMIPVYKGHQVLIDSGVGDEKGFVPTGLDMRHLDYPNIFAAGDLNAMTQPKLGHLAMMQADIACSALTKEVTGKGDVLEYTPEVYCIMNMGGGEAGCVYSNIYFKPEVGTDIVWHGPHNATWKKILDEYMLLGKGRIPPRWAEHMFKKMMVKLGFGKKGK